MYDGDSTFTSMPDESDLRFAIRDIKVGRAADAIFHLQRDFAHDTEIVEIIESEWRKS